MSLGKLVAQIDSVHAAASLESNQSPCQSIPSSSKQKRPARRRLRAGSPQRHREQSQLGPASPVTDHRKCSFSQGFIMYFAMPGGIAKLLIFLRFLKGFADACPNLHINPRN